MSDDRLILGIYLEPHVWLTNDSDKIVPLSLTPAGCIEIVFSKKLPYRIEVCVQRQGFIIAAFPEELMAIRVLELNTGNLLPDNAARFAIDFFNTFLFLLYDEMARNKINSAIKPAINLADLWKWMGRDNVDLATIATEQPAPIFNQHTWMNMDKTILDRGKSVGELTDRDKLFRPSLAITLVNNVLDAMFINSAYALNWQLTALLNKAVLSTQRGEFAEAHILSWAVIEKIIQTEWDEYLEKTNEIFDNGSKSINSERRQFLNGRDFTASVRIEILELAKILPYELYKRLGPIRRVRNNWMHNLGRVSLQDCRECYLVARDLLSRKVGLPIQHPGGYYWLDENVPRG